MKQLEPSEYSPFFAAYVELVPAGNIVDHMATEGEQLLKLLTEIDEDTAGYRYADGKWSIKEVVGHLIDTEQIFAYRALRFGRLDSTDLPGFEQNDYVATANFDRIPLAVLAQRFEAVRKVSLALFGSLEEPQWRAKGRADGNSITVRALAYIIVGHQLHHMAVIRERYLSSGGSR